MTLIVLIKVGYDNIRRADVPNCSSASLSSANLPAELQWSTCTSDEGQSILLISGAAPISEYMAVLRTVRYTINASEPDKSVLVRQMEVRSPYPRL